MRTRIAPTPSGYLHLGNVLSFAITSVLAASSAARVMLRIDDLDRQRVRKGYVEDIFATLNYLGIPWDDGPADYAAYETTYSQVHRLDAYRDALEQLREAGKVFACDCSRAQLRRHHPDGCYTGRCRNRGLPLDGEGYCWRMDTDETALPEAMQYFVVRKKDGMPAYQLASLVDDMHFGTDLIVRGQDLLDSTAAQLFLADVLGYHRFREASFVHHRLLTDGTAGKLSKSAGATSVHYLRRSGHTPGDIYRAIGRMAGLPHPVSSLDDLAPSVPVFILPVSS